MGSQGTGKDNKRKGIVWNQLLNSLDDNQQRSIIPTIASFRRNGEGLRTSVPRSHGKQVDYEIAALLCALSTQNMDKASYLKQRPSWSIPAEQLTPSEVSFVLGILQRLTPKDQ